MVTTPATSWDNYSEGAKLTFCIPLDIDFTHGHQDVFGGLSCCLFDHV